MQTELLLHLPEPDGLSSCLREFVRSICQPMNVGTLRRAWFSVAWLFIGLVSLYDGYLVLLYQCCIIDAELNPLALLLIQFNGQDVSVMLQAKAIGTCSVLVVLSLLYRRAPRLAFPVTNAVTAFQFALLLFLNLA